ncbi:glucosaminidase domain-containing protein [Paenibacillus oryzisoli]|uniref:glucosaminidase domain-containing protein n=1 Tax=Paenibacillus oryzisoli TaxID=1850517 RepID=UPI003D2DA683
MNMINWWNKAKEASLDTGWFPTVILAQWQLETGNFTSSNLHINNNIAGQTWQPYMSESLKGTPRPASEGGFYIKYDDPVAGYVDFILQNGRYADVRCKATEMEQIQAIATAGWAVDPNYANKLVKILSSNQQQGFTLQRAEEESLKLDPGVANTIIHTWIGPAWLQADEAQKECQGDVVTTTKLQEQKVYYNWLANQLRLAAGLPFE